MGVFLTGPIWVGWTRPRVMRVVKGIERIPIVGMIGELLEGYLPLVDDYFYCEPSRSWKRQKLTVNRHFFLIGFVIPCGSLWIREQYKTAGSSRWNGCIISGEQTRMRWLFSDSEEQQWIKCRRRRNRALYP
jgi:hypothetical protein